jgi:hypothetical protein
MTLAGRGRYHLCTLLLGSLLVSGLHAAEQASGSPQPASPTSTEKNAAATPVYKPPRRGSPEVRVGGATRGPGDPLPALHVLTPDHIGLTVQAAPVFQWYLSKPADVRFEFALINDSSIEPLLELDLGRMHSRGIQQLNLAKHGIELQPGITYQWSVALVPDEQARSSDVIASGMIERIAIPKGLADRLAGASRREQVNLYAQAGIWYDSLELLSELITEHPADRVLREQRAALLEQVGLPAAVLDEK